MTDNETNRNDWAILLSLAGLLAVATYLLSCIPYEYAEAHAPQGSSFIGQVAVIEDVNGYFSYIRQAAEGHWLFRNAMTHMQHEPVFVNVEWLAVGWGMALFGWSTRAAFEAWRIAGAFTILIAFAALALVTLPTRRERIIALLMFAFGGGFGWFMYLLSLGGLMDINSNLDITNPAFDLSTAPHPFGQIVKNPHFALPHGTFLVFVACYLMGEKTGKRSWYGWSAAAVILHGLIRCYDLISLFAILPAFIVVEAFVTRRWDWERTINRAIPFAATGLSLVYYVYIFKFHPVFKYVPGQGAQPFVPFLWHALAFGLSGLLCVWRICRFRRYPLATSLERFLLVWLVVLMAVYHSNKVFGFMAFSPQLGVPLVAPMILLGVVVFRGASAKSVPQLRSSWVAIVACFLIVNALSTPLYLIRTGEAAASDDRNYIRNGDLEAIAWLQPRVHETDVIVSNYPIGTKIAQLLTATVLLGHWAFTPQIEELSHRADRFLAGEMEPNEAESFLDEVRARYVYVSPRNERAGPEYFQRLPGLAMAHENESVMVFVRKQDDL